MISQPLQEIWTEYLAQTNKLLQALHEQTAAVILRDPARLERLQPELERQIAEVRTIDERAIGCARQIAEQIGSEPSFRCLVKTLDAKEGRQLQAMANKVIQAAQRVQGIIRKNQTLIENEMAFNAGSLALIAKAVEEDEGSFAAKSYAAVLVDQVA